MTRRRFPRESYAFVYDGDVAQVVGGPVWSWPGDEREVQVNFPYIGDQVFHMKMRNIPRGSAARILADALIAEAEGR